MEKLPVRSIRVDDAICRLRLSGLPDTPGLELRVMDRLRAAGVPFEVVSARLDHAGSVSLTLLLPDAATDQAAALLQNGSPGITEERVRLAFVRIEGGELADTPGAARRFIKVLAARGIQVQILSTSRTEIAGAIDAADGARAVTVLAEGFEVRTT